MTHHRLLRPTRILGAALTIVTLVLVLLPEQGPAGSNAAATAPSVSALPGISGTAVKGTTLTASSGSWAGTTPIDFTFRWVRCDTAGASCVDVSGATAATYVLVSTDVGKRMRVRVQASNADGTATALSAATAIVTSETAPTNTQEPRISGSAVQGQTLSATSGSWSGTAPISFTFQWVRCGSNGGKPDGSDCPFIGGATSATYQLRSEDVGRRLRARVTAKNEVGTKTVASDPTATVAASTAVGKPVNTTEPRISGTPAAGQTLSATAGSWSGATPISISYRWVRCGADGGKADGSNCSSIGGATRSTYTPGSSDVGRRLRVRVTARNGDGSSTAASNPTATIGPAAPTGTITLPNGERSIPASSVPADQRLVVDAVQFSPNPVRSRTTPLTVRIKVKDTRGFVVRDARVFIRSTPRVTTGADGVATATDGWLQVTLVPLDTFPQIRKGFNVQFFVKAYRAGDPVLGGVAGTRLVQVALGG